MAENQAWDLFCSGELDSYYEFWLMAKYRVTMDEAIDMANRQIDSEIFVKEWM